MTKAMWKPLNTKILRNACQLLFTDSRNSTVILLKTALARRKLINISVLASVFETVRCPLCKQGHAVLEEEKMGLASLLILKCSSSKCKFEKLFYTFNKVVNSQAFEVNRRVVLATRNIGVGHQGLVKFCGVMNMLPPMQENLFQDHLKAVKNAAQTAAEKCMSKAADEVKGFYEPEQDDVYNYWRRRGFSSCYGDVTKKATLKY